MSRAKFSSTKKKQGNAVRMMEDVLEGGDGFVRSQTHQYILNLVERTQIKSKTARDICHAAEMLFSYDDSFCETFPKNKPAPSPQKSKSEEEKHDFYYKRSIGVVKNAVVLDDWNNLKAYLKAKIEEDKDARPKDDFGNLQRLSAHLGLSDTQKALLDFIYVSDRSEMLDDFVKYCSDQNREKVPAYIARAIGSGDDLQGVMRALGMKGTLAAYGFLYSEDDTDYGILPKMDGLLLDTLADPASTDDDLVHNLLGKTVSTDLSADDFDHHRAALDDAANILKHAVERGEKGINILLYGPAGGGKTEMAKVLAEMTGARLYSVGEEDDDDFEGPQSMGQMGRFYSYGQSSNRQRMAQLRRAQALLTGSKNAALLFDEIEDLLLKGTDSDKSPDTESKIEVNRMLENNPVATIWTGNNPEKFHDAVRDRFTYSIFVDYPPTIVRRKVWEKQLSVNGVTLGEEDVLSLARRYDPPPRMIAKACRMAAMTGGGMETIRKSIEASARLRFGDPNAVAAAGSPPEKFLPELIGGTAANDVSGTMNALIARGREGKPFKLYVEGEAGSGRGTALQYMAENMSRHVLSVDIAELVAPHPMMPPEAKIRSAFNAAADGTFVVLNNIEEISTDPDSHAGKWDHDIATLFMNAVMECKGTVAVTTTRKSGIPDWVRKSFSHHMAFQPLSANQAGSAYKAYFGQEPPKSLFDGNGSFVPADFDRAAKILTCLDLAPEDHAGRLTVLQDQATARRTESLRPGFV